MSDDISQKPLGQARGRFFEKGRWGNPAAGDGVRATTRRLPPRRCSRGESEALTRKAAEMALAGDPTAMRLCIERVLPPCRERTVKFRLPPVEGTPAGEICGLSPRDVYLER